MIYYKAKNLISKKVYYFSATETLNNLHIWNQRTNRLVLKITTKKEFDKNKKHKK